MLPQVYMLTADELKANGIAVGDRKDVVKEIIDSYEHMFLRPAMYVGRADPDFFLRFVENEMRWLNYFCRCLPINMFWSQKQLGSTGPFSILRDRTTRELLPKEEAFAAIKRLVYDHLEWMPKHIVVRKESLNLPVSEEAMRKFDFSAIKDISIFPEVAKLFEELRAAKQEDQTIIDGPSYCGNGKECYVSIQVINRKLDTIYWWDKSYLSRARQHRLITGDSCDDSYDGDAEQASA